MKAITVLQRIIEHDYLPCHAEFVSRQVVDGLREKHQDDFDYSGRPMRDDRYYLSIHCVYVSNMTEWIFGEPHADYTFENNTYFLYEIEG
jgi:hypothetical protein